MDRLAEAEALRYNRQIILPGWGEKAQRRVKSSCVFVAGAGGLGSPVAIYLAAAGVGCLRICDSGAVELSNLNRQILHGEGSIGEAKVESARQTLARVNPLVTVVPLPESITTESVGSLVGEAALMVDCLDNFPTRHLLNAYAVKESLPLVHAGVSGLCGQITFINPPHTACLACLLPEAPPSELFPILGATAGLIGALQAMEALKYLTGIGERLEGRLLFFDGRAMELQEVLLEKDPRCPVCGSAAPPGPGGPLRRDST